MSREAIDSIFLGAVCEQVIHFETGMWRFQFANGTHLDVSCPWRVVANGRIALGDTDDGQRFGLPDPVNAAQKAQTLLTGPIEKVTVRQPTGDLWLEFEGEVLLELFNSSSGYEGWECATEDGRIVVATGGGELTIFPGRKD